MWGGGTGVRGWSLFATGDVQHGGGVCVWGGGGTGVRGWSLLQGMFSMGEVGGWGTGVSGWSLFATGDVQHGGGVCVCVGGVLV